MRPSESPRSRRRRSTCRRSSRKSPVPSLSSGIRVGKRDLDNNDHVNNVRYVEWALESLPEDFVRGRVVGGVKVHYKKELQGGDEAELLTAVTERDGGAVSDHSIRAGNREYCRLRMEWTDRISGGTE